MDTEREFLVESMHLRVRHLPKQVVKLGRHPVVVVADLPANVPEVDLKAEGVPVALLVSPVISARSCSAAREKRRAPGGGWSGGIAGARATPQALGRG